MTKKIFLACILVINSYFSAFALDAWIRINQLGYTPDGIKAVLVSESALDFKKFRRYTMPLPTEDHRLRPVGAVADGVHDLAQGEVVVCHGGLGAWACSRVPEV